MSKTVFIGHPISGDIEGNIKKILAICAKVHTSEIIPVAPYLVSLRYLDDAVAEDRQLGIAANHECFRRGYINELWLFGDRISEGMADEVYLAQELHIPIFAKTSATARDLAVMEHAYLHC